MRSGRVDPVEGEGALVSIRAWDWECDFVSVSVSIPVEALGTALVLVLTKVCVCTGVTELCRDAGMREYSVGDDFCIGKKGTRGEKTFADVDVDAVVEVEPSADGRRSFEMENSIVRNSFWVLLVSIYIEVATRCLRMD